MRLELDLTAIRTPLELQRLLFDTFQLPGWYGFNWNAFSDSITDPTQSTLPAILVVRGWKTLAACMPDDARFLKEDLEEAFESRAGHLLEWIDTAG